MSEILYLMTPLGVPFYKAFSDPLGPDGKAISDFTGYSFRLVVKKEKSDTDAQAVAIKDSGSLGGVDIDETNKVISMFILDTDDWASVAAGDILQVEIMGFDPSDRPWLLGHGTLMVANRLSESITPPGATVPSGNYLSFGGTWLTFQGTSLTFSG